MKYQGKTLLALLSLIFLFSCNRIVETNHELSIMQPDSSLISKINDPVFLYGLDADSYVLDSGRIKRNSFLSDILTDHGVSLSEIDQALENSKKVFDVRKVLPGRNYIVFCDKSDSGKAKYLAYDHSPEISYIFSFNDSLNITAFRKKIRTEIKYASGTISSSLWEAMMEGGMHASLAAELANIFQWSVDFFGLQKGDSFKVVYEEKFIDDESLGTNKILTAMFTTSGTTYTAIPFIQDGNEAFYDADGKSLKKAFLKAPLKFSRISSRFTASRFHPILKIRRPHFGVDYAAPVGTEVHAVGDGKVISVTSGGGEGRMVKIKHNSTYTTAYMHLSRFGQGISAGSMVRQGQVIGYVGSSGLSTGPHLDFRFYQNGSPIDPLKVIAPPAEPVTDANRERFEMIKQVNLSLLSTF
jgi:murein DD-endopeptidase MepM/ murein hydrolase activator NlpD